MNRNAQVAKALGLAEPKPHKFGARRTTIDGISFPSLKEASRYAELVLLKQAGDISRLEIDAQTPIQYRLEVCGVWVATYRPDFRYWERGQLVVEDVKSVATRKLRVYQLKKKLLLALYGITVREV